MRSILAATLALVFLSPAMAQTRRRVTILEEDTPAPAPVVTYTPATVYVPATTYYTPARIRVLDTSDPCAAPVPGASIAEIRRGPLGIRSDIRYSNGVEIRYGLFGRVREIRQR